MMYPKVLVFGNNCFSKTNSNGRTLGTFFLNWPKDKLAQFYIQNAEPDFSYCSRYFKVTDAEALRCLFGKKGGGAVTRRENTAEAERTVSDAPKKKRTPLTMLMREAVWTTGRWKSKEYTAWVRDFAPEIILLQAGDCAFMFRTARKTAKQFHAKLVIFNTEGYYFKQYDYFRSHGIAHLLYPVFRRILLRETEKAYRASDFSFFNCDSLKEDFDKAFGLKAAVLYAASEWVDSDPIPPKETTDDFIVSYAGNLGVGRPDSLVAAANALHGISERYYLDVYGSIPDDNTKKLFEACSGIRYHGRVSYEEVKKIADGSDLLIHVESFDPYYVEDLKYAFSTKIADCLSSNRCFMIAAPADFAETKYLRQTNAAYVVDNPENLEETLRLLITDPSIRYKYTDNALRLARNNHSISQSVGAFQTILHDLTESS